jgi:hypothetical protein
MSKSYIKQAEQNVLNQAKFWTELLDFLDSFGRGLQHRTNRYSPGVEDFQQGVSALIQGAYKEQQQALARCYALAGIGGEEAQAYARERALEVFDGKYTAIQWLDEWCRTPRSWTTQTEREFKEEVRSRLSKQGEDRA